MAYRSRSSRRLARRTRLRFLTTIIIIILLLYASFNWILPNFINGLTGITETFEPSKPPQNELSDNTSLAPPVLNIPYEATNTAQITIRGYSIPQTEILIYNDEILAGSSESLADGSFEVKNIELLLGTNNIYGKTQDEKNKQSLPSKTIRLIYDNEKPTLEVLQPEDGITVTEPKVKIVGKAENAQVYINDLRIITQPDNSFSFDQNLNEGENNISIRAVDKATNSTEIIKNVTFKKQ